MIGHVDLSPFEGPESDAWRELLLLASKHRSAWCLVGAQMVTLHAMARGMPRPVRTRDFDVLVDVRSLSPRRIAEFLVERGFALDGISRDGVGHRFVRDRLSFDVLAIDNAGERANRTTLPPAHTVSVPGGRQAIARLDEVGVTLGHTSGSIPIPDWLGALVLKSRAAVSVREHRPKHLQDVALLLGLPVDLQPSLASITKSERKYIGSAIELLDDSVWRAVSGAVDELAGKAAAALLMRPRA